jgi:hypothetical protein
MEAVAVVCGVGLASVLLERQIIACGHIFWKSSDLYPDQAGKDIVKPKYRVAGKQATKSHLTQSHSVPAFEIKICQGLLKSRA